MCNHATLYHIEENRYETSGSVCLSVCLSVCMYDLYGGFSSWLFSCLPAFVLVVFCLVLGGVFFGLLLSATI